MASGRVERILSAGTYKQRCQRLASPAELEGPTRWPQHVFVNQPPGAWSSDGRHQRQVAERQESSTVPAQEHCRHAGEAEFVLGRVPGWHTVCQSAAECVCALVCSAAAATGVDLTLAYRHTLAIGGTFSETRCITHSLSLGVEDIDREFVTSSMICKIRNFLRIFFNRKKILKIS